MLNIVEILLDMNEIMNNDEGFLKNLVPSSDPSNPTPEQETKDDKESSSPTNVHGLCMDILVR